MTTDQLNSRTVSRNTLNLFESITAENPLPHPPRLQALIDYDKLSRPEQFKVKENFFKDEAVKEYLDLKWKVESHNKNCFEWLVEYRDEFMDKENTAHVNAIQIKLDQFAKVIRATVKPFQALYIDPSKYGVDAVEKYSEVHGWQE